MNRDLDPFQQAVRQLQTIPGVSDLTAQVIVSEIGVDMSRFATAGHLDLVGRPVPAQRRERRQAPLHAAAQGRALAKDHGRAMRLGGQPQKGQLFTGPVPAPPLLRRGPKKAICAVAASILTAAYHMLRNGTFYQDLGADHSPPLRSRGSSKPPRP